MYTLTMTRAAQRWSGCLPGGARLSEASEPDLWAAIFAGAAAGQAGPGEVTFGQQVFELDHGEVAGRYVTQRTERGHLTWVAMGPGLAIGAAAGPAGTYTSPEAAMEGCRKRSARPLDWTGQPDGTYRAGSARQGHWKIFLSIVEA